MPHVSPEARAEYQRKYRETNRQRKREQSRLDYARHAVEIQARRKAHAETIPIEARREKAREYARVYRERHRTPPRQTWRRDKVPKSRANLNAWIIVTKMDMMPVKHCACGCGEVVIIKIPSRASTHLVGNHRVARPPEEAKARKREQSRAHHVANRERRRKRTAERYHENPEKFRLWALAHQARKRRATMGLIDLTMIAARTGRLCEYCGRPLARKDWSLDHILPLSKGGAHSQENVRYIHRLCNSARQATGPGQLRMIG